MVNSDVNSVNCNITPIQYEEEKDDSSKSNTSDFNSSGSESVAHSSRKSSCNSSSSGEKHSDTPDTSYIENEDVQNITAQLSKQSLFCSVPLNRIRAVLGYNSNNIQEGETSILKKQMSRKLLCLYCDRTFVSSNLRQKHVERCHSEKQSRRLSSRKLQSQFTTTACFHCDKLPVEHSLRQLFEHLITDHSEKYFGCLTCEERFLNQSLLNDHNAKIHSDSALQKPKKTFRLIDVQGDIEKNKETKQISKIIEGDDTEHNQKLTRSMAKEKKFNSQIKPSLRQLRNKKIAIKASKIGSKRSKRLQAAQTKVPVRKKRTGTFGTVKLEETTSKSPEKIKSLSVNPYPEFDNYYRVKKITDHSIDNLKISSLTFDDVFDKAFFSRIKCNIQENLMYHLDGKLFKNEESENRISNFEKNPPPQDVPSTSSENFGCDLSLNALTPVTSILTPHFGEDLESQIEYGSKPSKKKLQPRQDPVRHKYVTRRKYQASILEHKENRDLSKLDMWTQLIIKDRQQKVMNDQKSAKEMLEYTTCVEYKLKVQRNELNRILDRRGPFEDLKEEASKKAALDKLNAESTSQISEECFKEVRSLMEDLLNEVIRISSENREDLDNKITFEKADNFLDKVDIPEFPDYLKLRRTSIVPNEEEIDKSDKIALICSSQETENYELPTNTVRAKNEMVELSGEWARSRIYVCAACGLKLSNMKLLLEHKSLYHQNAWVQHYEFVGNQSELYRHLCIPGLGKVGYVEDTVQCKLWRRSEARMCTKCGKICNALAELHRHILECGGDWTWMLARKKCKYRPFGSRKKKRGLVKRIRERINNQKTEQTEKKKYKKRFEGPRQRPSDADTIQRMLANLPPKRSSRKSICMKDGFPRNLNKTQNKKKVMKCGKIVMKKSSFSAPEPKVGKRTTNHKKVSVKRTLRSLNRTLSSKILDTSNKLRVKRQLIKNLNRRSTRRSTIKLVESCVDKVIENKTSKESVSSNVKKAIKCEKNKSENNTTRVKKILQEKINIKNFFPVSKRKLTRNNHLFDTKKTVRTNDEKEQIESEGNKSSSNLAKLMEKSINFSRKRSQGFADVQKLKGASEPIVVIEKMQQSEGNNTKQVPSLISKLSNKRKLRSSFRKVIDKVKKLKIDNSSSSVSKEQSSTTNTKPLNSFLGQGKKEKEKLPTILVPLVEEPRENPPSTPAFVQNAMNNNSPTEESLIPENIFNLEHNSENLLQAKSPLEDDLSELRNNEAKNAFTIDADMKKECEVHTNAQQEITVKEKAITETAKDTNSPQSIVSRVNTSKEMSFLSIETSVKSDKSPMLSPLSSPSALSPRMKGKLRKPNRGLNDCIAMLTKKAFEVTTNMADVSSTHTFAKPLEKKPILDNKNVAHKFVRPNECILKIPVFETESQKNIQNEVLDLSKPKKNMEDQTKSAREDAIGLSTFKIASLWEPSDKINQIVQNRHISSSVISDFWKPLYSAMQNVIPNCISDKAILKIPKIVETSWTTVDDIIQRVVENSCESSISRSTLERERTQLKIPSVGISNSVDKVIEEVVKGKMTHSKDLNIIAKRVDDLIESTFHIQRENKILNSTNKRKSRKLIQKNDISIIPSNILDSVNNVINIDTALKCVKELNPKEIYSSILPNPTGISNDSRSLSSEKRSILIDSTGLSEEKETQFAVDKTGLTINSQITNVSSVMNTGSKDSNNSNSQDMNTGFTEVVPVKISNKKEGKKLVQGRKRTKKIQDSNELTQTSRIDPNLKSDIELISENKEMFQTDSIQPIQSEVVTEFSPKEDENISEIPAGECIGSMKFETQISESQVDEKVDTEEKTIEVVKKEIVSLNKNVQNYKYVEATELTHSYSIPEAEPNILEVKPISEDISKISTLFDSEDELPLVILKAKSKTISTMPLISVSNENHKSLEKESNDDVVSKLDNISEISEVNCFHALKNTDGDDISAEFCGNSPLNKLITGEFPFSTFPQKEKASSIDQIKCKEVNEYSSDIQCKERSIDSIGTELEQKEKVNRRRSPRKSIAIDEIPDTRTNNIKKNKSTKSGKSKNLIKTMLSFKTEKESVDKNDKKKILAEEKICKDKELISSIEEVNCDRVSTTETSFFSHSISDTELIAKNHPPTEKKDAMVEDSKKSNKPEDVRTDKNDETFSSCLIPIFKVAKMKSKNKNKNKSKAIKTKLILKLPKIILKEPTLKFPFSETVLEEKMTKIEEQSEEFYSNNLVNKQNSTSLCSEKIHKPDLISQDFIEKPVKSGITLKLKAKLKKRGNKKEKNISEPPDHITEEEEITPLPSELAEGSIILTDILKVIPVDSSVTRDLSILSEKNISSKGTSKFRYDKPGLDESENLTQSSNFHNLITSVSKLEPSKKFNLKQGVKKKKTLKNITSCIASSKKVTAETDFPKTVDISDSEKTSEIEKSEVIEAETFKMINAYKMDEKSSNVLAHCPELNETNNSHKKRTKTKTKKTKTKTGENNLNDSSDIPQSVSNTDISSNNLTTEYVVNQTIVVSTGEETQVSTLLAQDPKITEESIKSLYNSNESEKSLTIQLDNHLKIFNNTETTKSAANENRTRNSEVEMDSVEHDDSNNLVNFTPLGYPSLEYDNGIQFKKSNSQNQIDEKKEFINSKPVRSLRSTVKISYKRSNIFAFQVENEEIVDPKITEKSKQDSTENIEGVLQPSDISISNINHNDEIEPDYTNKKNGKTENGIILKKNNTLVSEECSKLDIESVSDKLCTVPLIEPSQNHKLVIQQAKKSILEVEKIIIKKPRRNTRSANDEIEERVGNTIIKEVEGMDNISINIPNLCDLHSEALLPVHDSEDPGHNDTVVIATNIKNAKELDINNKPTSDIGLSSFSKEIPFQVERLDYLDVVELHPLIYGTDVDHFESQGEIECTEKLLEEEHNIVQRKFSKIKKSKKGTIVEFDDLSLAELQALSVGSCNDKNETDTLSHMKLNRAKKPKKRKTTKNNTNLKVSNKGEHLCSFVLNVPKNEEDKNRFCGITSQFALTSTELLNIGENTLSDKEQYKKKLKKKKNRGMGEMNLPECQVFVNNEKPINNIEKNKDTDFIIDENKKLQYQEVNDVSKSKKDEIMNNIFCSNSMIKKTIEVLSQQGNDAFEYQKDLIPAEELSLKYNKDKDTNIQGAGDINNISRSSSSDKEITDKLKGNVADFSQNNLEMCVNVNAIRNESELMNVGPMKRSRTAKAKALENINTLDKKIDEPELLIPEDRENFDENEITISKKKKCSKILLGKNKQMKNNEVIHMTDIMISRRNRTAKVKALENICNLEKINDNVCSEDGQIDVTNNLNKMFLVSQGSIEPVSSSHTEEKQNLTIHNKHDVFNDFEDISNLEEKNIQPVDGHSKQTDEYLSTELDGYVNVSTKTQTSRIEDLKKENEVVYSVQLKIEKENFSFDMSQTQMNNQYTSATLKDKITSDIIIDKSDFVSTAINYENNIVEPFTGDDTFREKEENNFQHSVSFDKDACIANDVLKSEINKKEQHLFFTEDIVPIRKSRLAKSKALENINDLKNRTDNMDFEIDIIGSKNISDKISKRHRNRKSENSKLHEENILKDIPESVLGNELGKLCQITKKNNKLNQSEIPENKINLNIETLNKIEKEVDCYDISNIDEDVNLDPSEPVLFSTMKNNKTIKSKVFQNKKRVHASDTEPMKFNTSQIDDSESKCSDMELNNRQKKAMKTEENVNDVLLSQEIDNEYEQTNSSEKDSILESPAIEILKDDSIDKRHKAKYSKKISEERQNNKKSKSAARGFVENLKAEEYLIDAYEILSNKSSERKSEKELLIENEMFPKKSVEIEHFERSTSEKSTSVEFRDDGLIRTEADTKIYGNELDESENKRSRRACKVNTYNENDLAEAMFMQAPVEKEKEKSKKKQVSVNSEHCSILTKASQKKVLGTSEKKMNSDELFDLLKATTTEKIGKPPEQSFPDTINDMQNQFIDDNFDVVFEDILKKSQALFGEKSRNEALDKSVNIHRSNDTSDNIQNFKDVTKSKNTMKKSLENYFAEDIKSSGQSAMNQNGTSRSEDPDDLFCEICKKSFKRIDNLIKHRTTLTHISKLSEIEAKQAEDKMRDIEQDFEETSETSKSNQLPSETSIIKPRELESSYSYPPTPGNDALKMAEIITNSFEKSDSHLDKSFTEIVPHISEYRRYKSLGERKSFESDQGSSNISENVDTNLYEPHIPNNAGVILEKQITLLQNIIENRGLDYIDDISISSYQSLENSNIRDSPVSVMSSQVEASRNFIFPRNASCMSSKRNKDESFLKPAQVDDISEDSVNLKSSEDVKARKVLNRDEELFLECCSLLKSGSEVSNFSKKSNRTSVLNNVLKISDEPDMFESKNLMDKVTEESSDYSRMATPLGDSFGDTSNSNTLLSNWAENDDDKIDDNKKNYFNFDENHHNSYGESFHSSKFEKLVSKAITSPVKDASKIVKNRKQTCPSSVQMEEIDPDSSSKMPTKGALKVFEGLKVSISTVELNLEEVLNNSPPIKKTDVGIPEEDVTEKQFPSPKTPRNARKSKPVKNKQPLDDRFIFKIKKKSTHKDCEKTNLESTKEGSNKIPDVYDFEETQDNTDIFVKPDFKTFRTKGIEELRNENIFENNYEGQTLSSSSSSTNSLCKKPKTNECITKKKHMIMGRIFKNALKPKADEDIRDIPNIDHNELIENYVLSCTPNADDEFKKPKMTEEEMNLLFDKLLDKPAETSRKQNAQNKFDSKSSGLKKKLKIKCKKRQRTNSDSTDDEFGLSKIVKKRPSRKNAKEEDNSINLEQELKECIGVASRKSQRKCTSGKQNVLVEYWSSDESAFEAFLENHLQELSAKTDFIEQPSEIQIQKEQKIEEVIPSGKTNDKNSANEKDAKLKSKKGTSSKKKCAYAESTSSVVLPQNFVQVNRRKRTAAHPLYHWSSSSEDEMQDLIEVKSIRDDDNDDDYDEDRPVQHGWIVGDSPKKLVTMLAQAKGKKSESESSVKEQGKKKNSNS